jgi:hypothetical protein
MNGRTWESQVIGDDGNSIQAKNGMMLKSARMRGTTALNWANIIPALLLTSLLKN